MPINRLTTKYQCTPLDVAASLFNASWKSRLIFIIINQYEAVLVEWIDENLIKNLCDVKLREDI